MSICTSCGERIVRDGAEWGYCYECFSAQVDYEWDPEPEYLLPSCDICGARADVAVNGYSVCSYACYVEADKRAPREEEQ